MANEKTQFSDVFISEVAQVYIAKKSVEKSRLFQSGAVEYVNLPIGKEGVGGQIIKMPFWKPIATDFQHLSTTKPLETRKIVPGQDAAVLHALGNAWSANNLAAELAGSDPLQAVAGQIGEFWSRVYQKIALASLKGAFDSASMLQNKLQLGKDKNLDSFSLVDGIAKLGDESGELSIIAVHSATFFTLQKLGLLQPVMIPTAFNLAQQTVPMVSHYTCMGREVIVDDSLPMESDGLYTSYLVGKGAFGFYDAGCKVPLETSRVALAGDDVLISRRHFVLHPRGIAYKAALTEESPAIATLEKAATWQRVYEPKQVRIVQITHGNNAVSSTLQVLSEALKSAKA